MHIPLHRCLVTLGVLWLFPAVLWVDLQCVIVDYAHFLLTFFILIHIFNEDSAKKWNWGYTLEGVILGGGGGGGGGGGVL